MLTPLRTLARERYPRLDRYWSALGYVSASVVIPVTIGCVVTLHALIFGLVFAVIPATTVWIVLWLVHIAAGTQSPYFATDYVASALGIILFAAHRILFGKTTPGNPTPDSIQKNS